MEVQTFQVELICILPDVRWVVNRHQAELVRFIAKSLPRERGA